MVTTQANLNTLPDFATMGLDDFDNSRFRAVYLAHHGAHVEPPAAEDRMSCWTFFWSHGFMMTGGACSQPWAELWGCVFIYLWQYKKVHVVDAENLAACYVAGRVAYARSVAQTKPPPAAAKKPKKKENKWTLSPAKG